VSAPRKTTCQELVELITEYLEGTLPSDDLVRFQEYLDLCSGCRIYVEQLRQVVETLGKLTEEEIPEKAKQELLRVFRDWKRTS